MSVSITFNATYDRFEVTGVHFQGTSVGSNTATRLYFSASTFTSGQYDDRIFYIYSGTGSSNKIFYRIIDTGTNYLEIEGEWLSDTPDNTSAIRIICDIEDIYSDAANTGQIVKYSSNTSGNIYYEVTDASFYISNANAYFCSCIRNIVARFTTSTTAYLFASVSNSGWVIGYGNSEEGSERYLNKRIHISFTRTGGTVGNMSIFGVISVNFAYLHKAFNATLETDAKSYVNRIQSNLAGNDNRFINVTVKSNYESANTNNNYSKGYLYRCYFENAPLQLAVTTYNADYNGITLYNKNSNLNGYIQHYQPNADLTLSNIKILESPLATDIPIVSMNVTSSTNAILNLNGVIFPSTDYFNASRYDLTYEGQKTYVNATYDLKVIDSDNDPIVGASVEFICEDDASLNITGLTTDSNGEISQQVLRAYYYLRGATSVSRTDTVNWTINISKSGKVSYSSPIILNAIIDADGFYTTIINESIALTALDTTPPVWSTTTGIQSLADNENGTVRISYGTATDSQSTPVSYNIYAQEGSATGLFDSGNLIANTLETTIDVGDTLGYIDWSSDDTWYFGVRARDSLGNEDTNTTSLNITNLVPKFKALNDKLDAISNQTGLIPALAKESTQQLIYNSMSSIEQNYEKIDDIYDKVITLSNYDDTNLKNKVTANYNKMLDIEFRVQPPILVVNKTDNTVSFKDTGGTEKVRLDVVTSGSITTQTKGKDIL